MEEVEGEANGRGGPSAAAIHDVPGGPDATAAASGEDAELMTRLRQVVPVFSALSRPPTRRFC